MDLVLRPACGVAPLFPRLRPHFCRTIARTSCSRACVRAAPILIEAGVSFLGLGDPSVMTWGVLLHQGQHSLRAGWWLAFFPGAALPVTVLGIHLVADAISDRAARPGWER